MDDYPHVHALLVRLLGLAPGDDQLPLSVLMNLHRLQLRAPYKGLLVLAAHHASPKISGPGWVVFLNAALRERYPALGPEAFSHNNELSELDAWARVNMSRCPELVAIDQGQGLGTVLFDAYDVSFEPYEPVLLLLQLTWVLTPELRANRLRSLEIQLTEQPTSTDMILALAGASARPVQSE